LGISSSSSKYLIFIWNTPSFGYGAILCTSLIQLTLFKGFEMDRNVKIYLSWMKLAMP